VVYFHFSISLRTTTQACRTIRAMIAISDGFICASYLRPPAKAAAPAPKPTATSSAQPTTGITSGTKSIGEIMYSRTIMRMNVTKPLSRMDMHLLLILIRSIPSRRDPLDPQYREEGKMRTNARYLRLGHVPESSSCLWSRSEVQRKEASAFPMARYYRATFE
jgi:hypothetical protein